MALRDTLWHPLAVTDVLTVMLTIVVTVDEAEIETDPLELAQTVCVREGISETVGATDTLAVVLAVEHAVLVAMPVRE